MRRETTGLGRTLIMLCALVGYVLVLSGCGPQLPPDTPTVSRVAIYGMKVIGAADTALTATDVLGTTLLTGVDADVAAGKLPAADGTARKERIKADIRVAITGIQKVAQGGKTLAGALSKYEASKDGAALAEVRAAIVAIQEAVQTTPLNIGSSETRLAIASILQAVSTVLLELTLTLLPAS